MDGCTLITLISDEEGGVRRGVLVFINYAMMAPLGTAREERMRAEIQ